MNGSPVKLPMISHDPAVQARYEGLRLSGQSHNLAEILATRAFPGLRTDTAFLAGRCNGNEFEDAPALGDHYQSVAAAHGVSTSGKVYLRGLAEFPGDPRAWVSSRAEVQKLCRERGWSCEGAVTVEPPQYAEPQPDVPVAADLVDREVEALLAGDPTLDPGALRHEIEQIRSGAASDDALRVADIPEGAIGPDWS